MTFLAGIAITLYLLLFHKNVLDIKLDKVSRFLAFMAIVTAIRLALISAQGSNPSPDYGIKFWQYALVFWEDAFYVAPLLFLERFKVTKWGKIAFYMVAAGLSLHFASGHLYQGVFAATLTALYPYFISFYYSKRTSLGTVMVCHILYDMITVITGKVGWMMDYL